MRTRLITLAAILSIAALAAAPLANASGETSGGSGVSGSSGGSAGGGGAHGGGGGGGGHAGGGGGFRGGSGGMRVGGYVGGAGFAHGGFVSHGFYAAERGYGMVGSEAGGFGRIGAVPRGAHAAGNFAAPGPRFASAAAATRLAPRFASAARAAQFARMTRVAVRLPPVRPGHHPPRPKQPSVVMHRINLANNNDSCEDASCGPVMIQPFCLGPTREQLANPNYAVGPFGCPEALKIRAAVRVKAR